MSDVSAALVSTVLPKHGFELRKGDARRVAEIATGPSGPEIIRAATQLGITHHTSRLPSLLRHSNKETKQSPRNLKDMIIDKLEHDLDATLRASHYAKKAIAPRAEEVASLIESQFEGRHLDDNNFYEMANAIVHYVRNPDDILLAKVLFSHPIILSILKKNSKRLLKKMTEQWFDILEHNLVDFKSPLAKLFFALDDAWHRDGREWHVSIGQATVPSSFSVDNWMFLLAYAVTGGVQGLPKKFGVIISRFEKMTIEPKGYRLRSTGGLLVEGNDFEMLSISDVKLGHAQFNLDENGVPELPVRYLDLATLCPAFADAVGITQQNESKPVKGFNPTVIPGGRA
jgi:hypothetical protein